MFLVEEMWQQIQKFTAAKTAAILLRQQRSPSSDRAVKNVPPVLNSKTVKGAVQTTSLLLYFYSLHEISQAKLAGHQNLLLPRSSDLRVSPLWTVERTRMGHTNKMKPGLRGHFIFKRHRNTCSEVKGAIFCETIEIYNQTLRVQFGGAALNVRLPVITSAKYNFTGRKGVLKVEVCSSRAIWVGMQRRACWNMCPGFSSAVSSDIKCVEYPLLLALDSTTSASLRWVWQA